MSKASSDLFGQWLVVRRRTTDGCGDVRVRQAQTIVGMRGCREISESGAVECRHEEIAGAASAVAGEHAASAIGTVCRGREAEQQQSRRRITKSRNRPGPVDLIAVRALLLDRYTVAMSAEARTLLA